MTKVSKIPLRSDVWTRVFDLYVKTLADIKDPKELTDFIKSFYSPTERIVLAKRLALVVLLAKGQKYDKIREILKISPPTIAKMSLKIKYDNKGLSPVINKIFKKQSAQIAWKEIIDLFNIPTKSTLKSGNRIKRDIVSKLKINQIKNEF